MSELSKRLPSDPISSVGVVTSLSKAPDDYSVVSIHFELLQIIGPGTHDDSNVSCSEKAEDEIQKYKKLLFFYSCETKRSVIRWPKCLWYYITNSYLHYQSICWLFFSNNRFVFWSVKCLNMVKNVNHCFQSPTRRHRSNCPLSTNKICGQHN